MTRNPITVMKTKTWIDESFFATLGPKQAWFAGLFAADGYVKSGKYVQISQSGLGGRSLIDYVVKLLEYTGQIRTKPTSRQDKHSIWFNSSVCGAWLEQFGIVQAKSLIYTYPEAIGPFSRDFLRGYIEGDGSTGIYWCGKAYTLCLSVVGTEAFCSRAALEFPVQSKLTRLRAKNSYELRWIGKKAEIVADWLWATPGLFEGTKLEIVRRFKTEYSPRYRSYDLVREKARALLASGATVAETAKSLGLPFQSLYKWKQKGLL